MGIRDLPLTYATRFLSGLLTGLVCLWSAPAFAVQILYDLTNVGGNTFQYDYTIVNDDLSAGIDSFTIFFELGVVDSIDDGAPSIVFPADWDIFVAQADPGLPDDGIYDGFAFGAPIALGESLGGFSVQFDVVAGQTPGDQFFTINDPFNFATLFQGDTVANVVVAPVPEPSPGSLLAVLFGVLGASRLMRERVAQRD